MNSFSNSQPKVLGKFANPVKAIHSANRERFSILCLRRWNELLLDGNKRYIGTVNDSAGLTGTAYLQEQSGKAFGKTVECEFGAMLAVVHVDREFIGLLGRVLFFDQGFRGGAGRFSALRTGKAGRQGSWRTPAKSM